MMGKWLERLREHEKNRAMSRSEALKTIETPGMKLLRVLKVSSRRESAKIPVSEQMAGAELDSLCEERAAILEYDCGLPRGEAERLARIAVSNTIQPANVPVGHISG